MRSPLRLLARLLLGLAAALGCAVAPRCDGAAGQQVRLVTLPQTRGAAPERLVNRAVAERSIAVSGSKMLELKGVVPPGFADQLAAAYARSVAAAGELPTALPATYLGLQRPERFDTLVVPPAKTGHGERRSAGALVFLHGYAGNVGLICWLVSRAAAPHGLTTYCPSVGPRGAWWTRDGARTLAATLRHLRAQGVRRIYLAGLSNGAAGASALAPRFRRQLAGLILISGLARRARAPGLPTLLIHGRRDPAVPRARARRFMRRAGRRASQVTVPGDHYVLLTREAQVQGQISRWLGRRERQGRRRPIRLRTPPPSAKLTQ